MSEKPSKTILVTGASGFIGSHCLAPLLERGFEVHGVYRRAPAKDAPGVHWHACDLLDPPDVTSLVRRVAPTHLLHLAWSVEPGNYVHHVDNLKWVQCSIDLLRAFVDAGGRRVVTAGTCYEYDWTDGECSEESTPLAPPNLYGACKHALHEISSRYCRQEQVSHGWGRIFFLFGPREHPRRLVSSVIRALLRNEPAPCSRGDQRRDYLDVQELGRAFAAFVDSAVEGPCNLASGEPVAVRSIVTRIGELIGKPELLQLGAIPARPDDVPLVSAHTGRLAEEVGWRPATTLDEGLRSTIEWWRRHPDPGDGG